MDAMSPVKEIDHEGGGQFGYLGTRGLDQLRSDLSGRDLAIIRQVAELRLMSSRQIEAIHFPLGDHDTPLAATRACQRVLARLIRDRLLVRLERRLGGVRAGSASYVYAPGPVGQRIATMDGPRRRYHEPTSRFLDHTLAITQLVVNVTAASRSRTLDLIALQAEPRCYREFSGIAGRTVLRPDLFVAIGVGEFEHRWFLEVDRGQESIPVVIRKCHLYEAYYQSGKEQAAHGMFPKVCWIVPDERRAGQVGEAIRRDRRLTDQLFVVATTEQSMAVLMGAASWHTINARGRAPQRDSGRRCPEAPSRDSKRFGGLRDHQPAVLPTPGLWIAGSNRA